jgi:hypothetical protein
MEVKSLSTRCGMNNIHSWFQLPIADKHTSWPLARACCDVGCRLATPLNRAKEDLIEGYALLDDLVSRREARQ